jgi:hypothetical protein
MTWAITQARTAGAVLLMAAMSLLTLSVYLSSKLMAEKVCSKTCDIQTPDELFTTFICTRTGFVFYQYVFIRTLTPREFA